jgi:hypothetical protein
MKPVMFLKKMVLARLEFLTVLLLTIQVFLEERQCPWEKSCPRLKRS